MCYSLWFVVLRYVWLLCMLFDVVLRLALMFALLFVALCVVRCVFSSCVDLCVELMICVAFGCFVCFRSGLSSCVAFGRLALICVLH